MEWAKERRGTRTGDAPPERRHDMFIVLNVYLPIHPVKRFPGNSCDISSLYLHKSGFDQNALNHQP
jgi:hypothetical protein